MDDITRMNIQRLYGQGDKEFLEDSDKGFIELVEQAEKACRKLNMSALHPQSLILLDILYKMNKKPVVNENQSKPPTPGPAKK